METPSEPTTFKQSQGITNRITRQTEQDYAAAFAVSVQTMHAAEFLTDAEREEMTAMFARQTDLVAMMPRERGGDIRTLEAEEIVSALDHAQESIAGALKFDGAAKQVLTEAEELVSKGIDSDQSELIRHLHEKNLPAFESMARWTTISRAILRHTGIVLDVVSLSIITLMPQDQSKASMKSRLGTDDLQGLNRGAIMTNLLSSGKEERTDALPQQKLTEQVIALLRDRNVALGEVVPGLTLPFIRTYRSWQKAQQQQPDMLEAFVDASSKQSEETEQLAQSEPNPVEVAQGLQQELQALLAAHAEQSAGFRPAWAQMQRHGLRDFTNILRQMGRAGELAGVTKELPADTAKRLTGLLHITELLGQDPETLRERLVNLVRDEYITQVNINRILGDIRRAGVEQAEPDWLPVTRDLDFLLDNWKALEPKILDTWSPSPNRTRAEAVTDIYASLKAFRKARFEVRHPERRLERIAKPLGAVALPPEARPDQHGHTSSRQNQAVSDTLRAIAASEATSENKRNRALVISHFVDLAQSQRQEGDEEGFGELQYSKPTE